MDSCKCQGLGHWASALLGTALFLGQTLKTQGGSGSAWELAQVSEGHLTDSDSSHWTVQNIQPEHSILSTCTSSCCHKLAQTAPEMRAAKRGIPGMRPTPSAMEFILNMGHMLLFQYFDISLSLMSQSLGTLNLMQPPALLALPLVPVRWLPASGIVRTSVGKSISHSNCLVKGHHLLSQSFSHAESNLLSGNFLPQELTQLPYSSTCQLF